MKPINCHIHVFTDRDVAREFLPLSLVRIMATRVGFAVVAKILNSLNPFSNDDKFDRYVKFAEVSRLGSQKEIFLHCAQYYPEGTKFIIMAIDMEFMDAGRVPRNYLDQLDELAKLAREFPETIIPFIHIDPRRKNYLKLLEHATSGSQNNPSFEGYDLAVFKGVKLYPPLGHFPDDERVMPVYDYCNKHKLPIIAHAGPESPMYFRGSRATVKRMMGDRYQKEIRNLMHLSGHFAHPQYYEEILKKYPNLNICLAHWGSEFSWKNYLQNPLDQSNWFYWIKRMIQEYPNLYTDISMTMNNNDFLPALKILLGNEKIREKVLFGSDYYMVKTKKSEKAFVMDVRAYLGDEFFSQISHTNILKFLG